MSDDNSYSEYNSKTKKEPMSDDSINAVENWKGKGKGENIYDKPKKRKEKPSTWNQQKKLIVYCLQNVHVQH